MPNSVRTVDFIKNMGNNIRAAIAIIDYIDDKEISKAGRDYLRKFSLNMGEMYAQAVLQASIAASYLEEKEKPAKKLTAKELKAIDTEWKTLF